ncbi:MAG: prolipoprotein diacylglyceryl transferase [Desulfobacterales bacterium]|nr:prolipoprotein diacylglyceryl transferase [Desulfobacterales bacterium]
MKPILFHFDMFGSSFTIYSYGFMLLLAFISGCGLTIYLAGREGVNRDKAALALIGVIIAALIGARLMGAATNFSVFRNGFPLSLFDLERRGIVAYGGFIGGFLTLWAIARGQNRPIGQLMDFCAPGIALGVGFARIGCFLAGCCHGRPAYAPWCVQFPPGGLAYNEQVMQGLIQFGEPPMPVHPTQLYESVFGFLLFGLLLWLYPRRRFNGQVIAFFFGLYAVFRHGVEFLRGDSIRGIYMGISTSQYIAMGIIVITAVYLIRNFRGTPSSQSDPSRVAPSANGKKKGGGRK